MKKTILDLGKVLKRADQKLIKGGNTPIGPQGPIGPTGPQPIDNNCGEHICYAPSSSFCGTCAEFAMLSDACKLSVISHIDCAI
ncbi:hypothetical protein [uncultured Tenacibaculum sp.]|uniref:hypothetical protein n=1 Tax=uncultured Tenacibaculum sp. TaxID=174713 RepID=UPI00262EBC57|nr:hypothetical protein [uncultured Tenacibaculum sp.]